MGKNNIHLKKKKSPMPGTVLKAVLVLTHFIATVTLLLNILLHILVVWDT